MNDKQEYTCNLIRDLIPSYIAGTLSYHTREAIESHLETCEECKAYYESQRKDFDIREHKAVLVEKMRGRNTICRIIAIVAVMLYVRLSATIVSTPIIHGSIFRIKIV